MAAAFMVLTISQLNFMAESPEDYYFFNSHPRTFLFAFLEEKGRREEWRERNIDAREASIG